MGGSNILKTTNAKPICFVLFLSLIVGRVLGQGIGGKIVDTQGQGIEAAKVELLIQGLSTVSDASGNWSLAVTSIIPLNNHGQLVKRSANEILLNLSQPSTKLTARLFSPSDKLVKTLVDKNLFKGYYSFFPLTKELSPGMYVLKLKMDNSVFAIPMLMGLNNQLTYPKLETSPPSESKIFSKMAALDTLKVSKAGYNTVFQPLNGFNSDPINTVLTPGQGSSYELPPPDPCSNQFYVEGCQWDNANSTCGGVCATANACSPPESPDKGNLAKTFICPRFMMYSSEMEEAAADDAVQYNWSSPEDPPFTYGIVGHDADVGGLDNNESSCCQCYQLIFETPEPGSPQIGELSYPKSMVVQSFNTAASGPKGFDLFMGAGGYGAFNACYDDPNFGNTTQFDEFMYDEYPYQNPGSGGISFLRYSECESGNWPQTISGVESQSCQDKIGEQCDQALMSASPEGTQTTRQSCKKTNRSTSLYHQNWRVRAKRVQCPEALTRVTGCRLLEPDLPMPSPEIQTPADAEASGGFTAQGAGYHTTTMQDCCKPTCAWKDWVGDKGLPVDGEWNSFYSCNKDGAPLTQ